MDPKFYIGAAAQVKRDAAVAAAELALKRAKSRLDNAKRAFADAKARRAKMIADGEIRPIC